MNHKAVWLTACLFSCLTMLALAWRQGGDSPPRAVASAHPGAPDHIKRGFARRKSMVVAFVALAVLVPLLWAVAVNIVPRNTIATRLGDFAAATAARVRSVMPDRTVTPDSSKPAKPEKPKRPLAPLASVDHRVALVVGNADYQHAPILANPRNDAKDIAAALADLGFDVVAGMDLEAEAFYRRIDEFEKRTQGAQAALFYYAGHGMQLGDGNYLLPVDAKPDSERILKGTAVKLDEVLAGMKSAIRLVFLDACRDNPFLESIARARGARSSTMHRGLKRVRVDDDHGGMFIAYATAPGKVAADGDGRNSPFTAALKEYIKIDGLEVNALLIHVRDTVLDNTRRAQRPWSFSSLENLFYFVPPPPTGADPETLLRTGDAPDPATEMWLQIRDTSNARSLERYLAIYPNSRYRPSAEARLDKLRGQPFTVVVEPSSAEVRILNITAPYRAGMRLPAGNYRVEASAEGRETATEAVAHGSSPTLHRMVLSKVAAGPKVGEVFRDCAQCPEMVVVPAGEFLMGSPESEAWRADDEGPVHLVRIAAPFAVGVYEVTFAQWDACEQDGGCRGHKPDDEGRGRGRRPVEHMSWEDAQAYVGWLSEKTGRRYRLPSESEWEYAARAGSRTSRPWGGSESGQCRHANGADAAFKRHREEMSRMISGVKNMTVALCDDGHATSAPVGRFKANAWGLHDVLGNVWEWTKDCWNDSYAGAPADGGAWRSGGCSHSVLRGGSWYNGPRYLRSANRYRFIINPYNRQRGFGFRVVRMLTP